MSIYARLVDEGGVGEDERVNGKSVLIHYEKTRVI